MGDNGADGDAAPGDDQPNWPDVGCPFTTPGHEPGHEPGHDAPADEGVAGVAGVEGVEGAVGATLESEPVCGADWGPNGEAG